VNTGYMQHCTRNSMFISVHTFYFPHLTCQNYISYSVRCKLWRVQKK
jgi:hypothetical protein